jgi:hypothetical protein
MIRDRLLVALAVLNLIISAGSVVSYVNDNLTTRQTAIQTPCITLMQTALATNLLTPTVPTPEVMGTVQAEAQWPLVLSGWTAANANKWPTGDYANQSAIGNRQIVGTKYSWKAASAADSDLIAAPAMAPLSDFDIGVDAQQQSGGQNNEYGLMFRHTDPDSEYVFGVTGYGAYFLDANCDGQYNVLIFPTQSPVVKIGQVNHLNVVGTGSHFTLSVNGQVVAHFDESTLSRGTVGIVVNSYDTDNPQAVFEFSDFEVRAP